MTSRLPVSHRQLPCKSWFGFWKKSWLNSHHSLFFPSESPPRMSQATRYATFKRLLSENAHYTYIFTVTKVSQQSVGMISVFVSFCVCIIRFTWKYDCSQVHTLQLLLQTPKCIPIYLSSVLQFLYLADSVTQRKRVDFWWTLKDIGKFVYPRPITSSNRSCKCWFPLGAGGCIQLKRLGKGWISR